MIDDATKFETESAANKPLWRCIRARQYRTASRKKTARKLEKLVKVLLLPAFVNKGTAGQRTVRLGRARITLRRVLFQPAHRRRAWQAR